MLTHTFVKNDDKALRSRMETDVLAEARDAMNGKRYRAALEAVAFAATTGGTAADCAEIAQAALKDEPIEQKHGQAPMPRKMSPLGAELFEMMTANNRALAEAMKKF